MSDGEDFLTRWSRRKVSSRKVGVSTEDSAARDAPPPAEGMDVVRADDALSHTAELSDHLPRVEDLTAGSDLTAFLRDGVPESVRTAAVRKMWSLDPMIRDHVGISECSWDFHQPESIPGFGPIAAAVSTPDFFSRARTADATDTEAPAAPAKPAAAAAPPQEAGSGGALDPLPAEETIVSEADAHASEAGDLTEAAPAPLRRHGGALPRE